MYFGLRTSGKIVNPLARAVELPVTGVVPMTSVEIITGESIPTFLYCKVTTLSWCQTLEEKEFYNSKHNSVRCNMISLMYET